MISSTPNTKTETLPKPSIAVSAASIEANRRAARLDAKEVVAGFQKLAKQKAARKTPHQAA
jgi:hypothetical protein